MNDWKNAAPVIFVGHGSPMNIVANNSYTQALTKLGEGLSHIKAILSISAHWETEGIFVQSSEYPKTIYDFSGFPDALYEVNFHEPGAPLIAAEIHKKIPEVELTDEWGLDHGTWSVLVHLMKGRELPVLQLSLDRNLDLKGHYELGKKLAFLRTQGVMILASGDLVHNLYKIKWEEQALPHPWAVEFDSKLSQAIEERDIPLLTHFTHSDELFSLAHPSIEHYIPLLYAMGASSPSDRIQQIFQGIQNASISMTTYMFSVE